jgi:hypothetical protein
LADLDFRVKDGLVVGNIVRTIAAADVSVTSTPTVIDTFPANRARSAKYLMQALSGSEHQVSEILIVHDGSASQFTEYGVLYTGEAPLVAFSSDLVNGDVRLKCMSLTGSARLWFQRTTIDSVNQES